MTQPPEPAAEIERRLRWPAWPTLLFILNITLLAVAAGVSLKLRPRHPEGLPDDPRAKVAQSTLRGAAVATDGLRFRAAIFGGEVADRQSPPELRARAELVAPLLMQAMRERPFEPRVHAALAALDLLEHRDGLAARRYHWACELAPHYAEARLGLGIALARQALREGDPLRARALRLQAVAQFAAVDSTSPEYAHALFNRARLLAHTGPASEAERFTAAYLAREPRSPWADILRGESAR